MLTGDRGQHGQRGREAQLLNTQMPPPEGGGQDRAGKGGVEQAGREPPCWETGRLPFLLTQGWDRGGQRPYQGLFTESSSFMKPFCSIHLSLRNLDLQGQCVCH